MQRTISLEIEKKRKEKNRVVVVQKSNVSVVKQASKKNKIKKSGKRNEKSGDGRPRTVTLKY